MLALNYNQPLYRPPSEADNLIIQATYGCSFNQCSFCSMYTQKRYTERPLKDVFDDIDRAASIDAGIRRVFLADGDALTLETDHLLRILERLEQGFPELARVSCYATPANLLHKSAQELQLLRQHKLNLVYLGIETGNNQLLRNITKGATRNGIIRAIHNAHDNGIKVSATVILGLGGKQFWQQHIDDTVALLNEAPVRYLSTLQLFLQEDAKAGFYRKFSDSFEHQQDIDILGELLRLVKGLNPPQSIIFRSNHASNALPLAGNLPQDRDLLLRQIEQAIDGQRALRPKVLRGL